MPLKYKNIIVIVICVIALGSAYYYRKVSIADNSEGSKVAGNKVEKSDYVLPETLKEQGVTDVFHGKFYSTVDDGLPKEDGQRFLIKISSTQIGSAKGIVIVNDSYNKYGSLSKSRKNSPKYIFYTVYDTKKEWYTIVKAAAAPNIIDI